MNDRSNRSALLNLHAFVRVSCANGPGARAVVWTQGCGLRCPGCSNPLTHSHDPRIMVDPRQLAEVVLSIDGVEGVTVSGGEPFEQPAAVSCLCQAVRRTGLSVMVFTGWSYESILGNRNEAVQSLLSQIDILVDGPFVRHLASKDLLWRGSRNQRLRFLTDRYDPDILRGSGRSQVECRLAPGGHLQLTGFPGQRDIAAISERLAADGGIVLKPNEVRS